MLPFPFSEFRVCLPGALLVYNYGSAGCDFCFQFFNLNRFGPNNSKVLFHCCLFPFQNFVCACRALYSSTITDPLGATFASSSSISIVSVQITPKFSFIVVFSLFIIFFFFFVFYLFFFIYLLCLLFVFFFLFSFVSVYTL